MSSNDIAPGDLAFIIRGHCAAQEAVWLGRIVKVKSLIPDADLYCVCCLCGDSYAQLALITFPEGGDDPYPVAWLRKIEPLADDEAIEREAETVEVSNA